MNLFQHLKTNSLKILCVILFIPILGSTIFNFLKFGISKFTNVNYTFETTATQFVDKVSPVIILETSEEEYFIKHGVASVFSREELGLNDFAGEIYEFETDGREKYLELEIPFSSYGQYDFSLNFEDKSGNKTISEFSLDRVNLYNQEVDTPYLESSPENKVISRVDFRTVLEAGKRLPVAYAPNDLVELSKLGIQTSGYQYLRKEAADELVKINEELQKLGIEMIVTSAYRSYQFQNFTYNYVKLMEGEEAAKSKVALPGLSEHQLGLAIDIVNKETNYQLPGEGVSTRLYRWMTQNASKYGFSQTYSESSASGIKEEIWHWRYIKK